MLNKRCFYQCTGASILVLMFFSTLAQGPSQIIKKKKLAVSDFTGVPDEKSNYLARTNPVISLQYTYAGNCPEKGKISLQVETNVTVSPKSWMKVSNIKSKEVLNELLSHEQGHYDIGEIFAIDLKSIIKKNCFDKNNYKLQVDSLFKSMNKRYDSLQLRYDYETGHMFNKDMQTKWKRKIAAMSETIKSGA